MLACGAQDDPPLPPAGMAYIPGGQFLMGGKSEQAQPDELPRHPVRVSPFFIDIHEVTNRQFTAFTEATGYRTEAERALDWETLRQSLPPDTPRPPDSLLQPGSLVFRETDGPVNPEDFSQWWAWTIGADWRHPTGPGSNIDSLMDHPVVHVSRDDAGAYAKWAGKRLPTEAEWEWAAMGGLEDPKYPWGNAAIEASAAQANFWQGQFPYRNALEDGFYATAPVKSFPPNGYGLFDMAGNVWEWCADKYHVRTYAAAAAAGLQEDPAGPEEAYDPMEPYAEKYVMRGGSFLCNESYCSGYRVARRMRSTRDSAFNHTGFRCVADLP